MNCFLYLFVFLEGLIISIHGLNETCKKNSDCDTINSLCIEDECICDDLSYYNGTQCLPYAIEFGSICQEDNQCGWLGENSRCQRNRCVCIENHRWYKGRCQKYVDKGGSCASDDECYNGYDLLSLTCSADGVCVCRPGFYDRGYDCRKTALPSGDCALDIDCQPFLFQPYVCVLGKCTKKGNSSMSKFDEEYYDDTLYIEARRIHFLNSSQDSSSCESDGDCREIANSLCDGSDKKCKCNEETHYLFNGNCVRGINHCDSTDDCLDFVNNTECFKSSCICQKGFFLRHGRCIAELGMQDPHNDYESDSSCSIKPGQLVNSTCYCKNYWFNDEANRNCIKTMIQYTNTCLTNEWCAAMGPYSFCNSTTDTCQCSSNAKFNNTIYYCEPQAHIEDICLKDNECGINERCLNEQCSCLEDFSKNSENKCVPNIGGSCAIEPCSNVENSNCVGGLCKCDNNYIVKETRCLKIADKLEAPCEEQEQCQNIDHSMCAESENQYPTSDYNSTLRCVCEEGYIDVQDLCYQNKKLGDPCMTEAECTLVLNRSYKCRNSLCQCDVGEVMKNAYCTSAGSSIVASYLIWLAGSVQLAMFIFK